MVAGLYENRLRQNIMLQADPTIIYPITKGRPLGRRIRQSEIAAVNDYNTYAMAGLPEGADYQSRPPRRSRRCCTLPQTDVAVHGGGRHRRSRLLRDDAGRNTIAMSRVGLPSAARRGEL